MNEPCYDGNWENLMKFDPTDPEQRKQLLNEYCACYLTDRGWRCIPPAALNQSQAK